MSELCLYVPGAPRTKKSHNRVIYVGPRCGACKRGAHPKVMPSEAWTAWKDAAVPGLRATLAAAGVGSITWPVNCQALFFRDADRGDSQGLYQGLADVLQEGGVLADDKWIKSWDGSRLLLDRQDPHTLVVLSW